MGLSTDVRIRRSVTPKFPDRCVGCGEDAPGRTEVFGRRTSSWLAFLSMWSGGRHEVEVPCCRPCGARLRGVHRRRTVWTIAVTLVALALVFPIVEHLDSWLRRPVALGLILLALMPTIIVEVFSAPAFDMFVRVDSVDYEFADADYAREFQRRNEARGAVLED